MIDNCKDMLLCALLVLVLTVLSTTAHKKHVKFDIYWNIPTFMCQKYGIKFNVSEYGIVQNDNDKFRGDKVLILYDPGEFPAYISDDGSKTFRVRNKGIPQLGNLNSHLSVLRNNIMEYVPDKNFSGVGVLDFESWRPILRQNWGTLQVYRKKSYELEKSQHPTWTNARLIQESKKNFEHHARIFMQKSLNVVREMRPHGIWGYYAFPYCFNYVYENNKYTCSQEVKMENNELGWLFESSDVLYPSLYMRQHQYKKYEYVHGRLLEARRLAKRVKSRAPLVMSYVSYLYQDKEEYLSVEDLLYSILTTRQIGHRGVVLWGSSYDLNSKDKCLRMQKYVEHTLGPTVRYVREVPIKYFRNRFKCKNHPGALYETTNIPDTSGGTTTQDSSEVEISLSEDNIISNHFNFTSEIHTSTLPSPINDSENNLTRKPSKDIHTNNITSGECKLISKLPIVFLLNLTILYYSVFFKTIFLRL